MGLLETILGHWVGSFTRNIGFSSTIEAEFWAMRDGLNLALEWNIVIPEVEIDTLLLKLLILEDTNEHHQLNNFISDFMS
ncbi:hypothetical protein ACSBR1_021967 [Camellia fascicularis]